MIAEVRDSQPMVQQLAREPGYWVIEFVGGPASGKSTIESALREALVIHGHRPPARASFWAWAGLGRHWSLLTPLILLTRIAGGGVRTWSFLSKMLVWCATTAPFGWQNAKIAFVLAAKRAWLARSIQRGKGGHVLYPEFFVNSVAKWAAMDKISLQDGSAWLSSFYDDVSVLFVYVDTSVDECLRRLASRGDVTSHVQKMAQSTAAEYLRELKQVSESCLHLAASHSGARVIRVDGAGPVEATVQQLFSEVGLPKDMALDGATASARRSGGR